VEVLLSPSGRNILPGDLVTLTCQVNSSYPAVSSVLWLKDGVHLKADGRILQLSQATWSDAGVYTCQAGNGVGSLVSPPVSLHVFSESWILPEGREGSRLLGSKGARLGRARGLHSLESVGCGMDSQLYLIVRQVTVPLCRRRCHSSLVNQTKRCRVIPKGSVAWEGSTLESAEIEVDWDLRGWGWKLPQCALYCPCSG
jgi:hypothetical protein